jgi:hypothetical protein
MEQCRRPSRVRPVSTAVLALAGAAGYGVGTRERGQICRCRRRRCSWAGLESAVASCSQAWPEPLASVTVLSGMARSVGVGDGARGQGRNRRWCRAHRHGQNRRRRRRCSQAGPDPAVAEALASVLVMEQAAAEATLAGGSPATATPSGCFELSSPFHGKASILLPFSPMAVRNG